MICRPICPRAGNGGCTVCIENLSLQCNRFTMTDAVQADLSEDGCTECEAWGVDVCSDLTGGSLSKINWLGMLMLVLIAFSGSLSLFLGSRILSVKETLTTRLKYQVILVCYRPADRRCARSSRPASIRAGISYMPVSYVHVRLCAAM